ncbi:MAG TPA: hypothetical protein VM118_10540 [Acidobacteriota bacterium]|nr:hypothetical protein [Acidobacteriota bacterium]
MKRALTIGILISTLVLCAAAPSAAETRLAGELGLDWENVRFNNSLKDTARDYNVSRSLSSHYLDLRLEGPLVNNHFADYAARARLFGTYYRVSAETGSDDTYIKPGIPTYSATVSLFPQRSYPLRLYYSKLRNHTIRYESNNRSRIDLLSPELAVVRRYDSDMKSRGGLWKVSVTDNIDLTTEYKADDAVVDRVYDFGEDKDIWVVFTLIHEEPLRPTHDIEVSNTIENDTVIVFIDLDSAASVPPGMNAFFALDSGAYEVDIIPLHLNPYHQQVSVRGDMVWKIMPSPPATPNDLDQSTRAATALLRIGGEDRFTSETYYGYTDTREEVQRMTTFLNLFSNSIAYDLARDLKLRALTTYNQNDMTISDVTSQLSKNLMHQTSLRWGRRRGLTTSLAHSYSRMSTASDVGDLRSTTHMITNQNTYPFDRLDYTIDLKNSITLLSDNKDYVNNQYSTDLTNRLTLIWVGVEWEPRSQIKYSYNTQRNPGEADRPGNEIETRHALSGTIPRLGVLGVMKIKGEHIWRRREIGDVPDSKNRYFLDVSLTRKFGHKYRIMLMASKEKETYGDQPAQGTGIGLYNPARQDQLKSSYKIDLQLAPWDGFSLGLNAMTISQDGSRISRAGASLSANLPGLNIPIRSFVMTESRELEGLPKQTSMSMETKLSYRFRQITLIVIHGLTRENVLTETYQFQEIQAKLSRHFSVF